MAPRKIKHSQPTISTQDVSEVGRVVASGNLADGAEVMLFESAFAGYIGRAGGAATSTGSAALHLALRALGVREGDEVIVPTYACQALINAVSDVGAHPQLVDIDENGYNLSLASVRPKLASKTRAIIAAHMFGDGIQDIADIVALGIPVIEDCALAAGATVGGRKAGTFGDVAVFSFYATKVLTTGQGGMLLTSTPSLLSCVRDLMSYDNRHYLSESHNYDLTDFQAALGRSQLSRLDEFIERRRQIARRYDAAFQAAGGTVVPRPAGSVCYRYMLNVENPSGSITALEREGIECRQPVFSPLHRYFGHSPQEFPNAERAHAHSLSIPIYPSLSDEDVDRVIAAVLGLHRPSRPSPNGPAPIHPSSGDGRRDHAIDAGQQLPAPSPPSPGMSAPLLPASGDEGHGPVIDVAQDNPAPSPPPLGMSTPPHPASRDDASRDEGPDPVIDADHQLPAPPPPRGFPYMKALTRSGLVALVAGNVVCCSLVVSHRRPPPQYDESASPAEGPASAQASEAADIEAFHRVEWWLYKDADRTVLDAEPERTRRAAKLEELVFGDRGGGVELTPWEVTTLAKLVPIKPLIERYAAHYSISPMWATMFLTLESNLKPNDRNRLSDDYGLGQIKRASEVRAKRLGTDPRSIFFCPDLDAKGSIYDPQTNIIMAMLLHRDNIETYGLRTSDQAYAIYFRGPPGLNADGSLSDLTSSQLDALRERYLLYENIIPLFRLGPKELAEVRNADTRTLMGIYAAQLPVKETYRRELDYFLPDIEANPAGDPRSVLAYDDCVAFAVTLESAFGTDQTSAYRRLAAVGERLMRSAADEDLKRRVESARDALAHARRQRGRQR